jgi:beta-lactamase superfamily II metal-dependent hydrolase
MGERTCTIVVKAKGHEMHKLTTYPLGNADCTVVDLSGGEVLVFDFCHRAVTQDADDRRIDLAATLRGKLRKRGAVDVLAITHLDGDHTDGIASFFSLDYAVQYQGPDRIKIKELWVPAAVLTEPKLAGDALAIRQEARHRLRGGYGIKVFSRPTKLADWLAAERLKLADRQQFIIDAGRCVPTFTKARQGVEFFVHSPFAKHGREGYVDRNTEALVMQATFTEGGRDTRVLLLDDTDQDVLSDMVEVTKLHANEERLRWDIVRIPHHCSYLSLAPEKGDRITTPVKAVRWLYEEQGSRGGVLIATCWPIPPTDESDQPPHRAARNYYQFVADQLGGRFVVTMEYPSKGEPLPVEVTIDRLGATLQKPSPTPASTIVSRAAPRAGRG